MVQTPAIFYPASRRNAVVTYTHHLFSIFNEVAGVSALGSLVMFQEESIAPGNTGTYTTPPHTEVIIIPLFGGLELVSGKDTFVRIEELLCLVPDSGTYQLKNPYENDWVRFLHFQRYVGPSAHKMDVHSFTFGLKNMLKCIHKGQTAREHIFMGLFDSRQEATYTLSNPVNGLFAYVINGALELQNRLLEAGDAILLTQILTVELEALAENSMLMITETSGVSIMP